LKVDDAGAEKATIEGRIIKNFVKTGKFLEYYGREK
jgi:hypothetical protein